MKQPTGGQPHRSAVNAYRDAGSTTSRSYHDVKAVRGATDIIKLIGWYVPLRRVGASGRYFGLCPFHKDKTPSLSVDQSKGLYHCFGCGAGGDVIKFVMEADSLTFPEALRRLAERAGIGPTGGLSRAERQRYAVAAASADELAERLANFVVGLGAVIERPLAILSGFLVDHGINPAEALHVFHRGVYVLRMAAPTEVAGTWLAMKLSDPKGVARIERIGCEDRAHAEYVTNLIVDMLARAQKGNVAA